MLAISTTAAARTYSYDGNLAGETTTYLVQLDETLYDIARRNDMGVIELLAANPGTDLWKPEEGSTLIIPSAYLLPDVLRKGIVINLAELRLYFFPDKKTVLVFPIGIGTEGKDTPLGMTSVTAKRIHPVWIPPDSIRKDHPDLPPMIPPGPNNPMGDFALNLAWPRVAIHGTNRPWSIGTRSSHGCIRMYPEDIATLFKLVRVGTRVTVINDPVKLGLVDGKLYIAAHPTLTQSAQLYDDEEMSEEDDDGLDEEIALYLSVMLGKPDALAIDDDKVQQAIQQRRGWPVQISK